MAGSITNGLNNIKLALARPLKAMTGLNGVAAFRRNGMAASCAEIEKATTAKMEMSYKKPISALPRHQNRP